jgi:hypothetical protein
MFARAASVTIQAGNLVTTFGGTASPIAMPKNEYVPVTANIFGKIKPCSPANQGNSRRATPKRLKQYVVRRPSAAASATRQGQTPDPRLHHRPGSRGDRHPGDHPEKGHRHPLDLEDPVAAGGSGSAIDFKFKLGRTYAYKGKKVGYFEARCPDGKFKVSTPKILFKNEAQVPEVAAQTVLKGGLFVPCTPKG